LTQSGYILDLAVFLVFSGAAVAEGAGQPGAVVPGDVLYDCASGGGPGELGLQAGQLALDRGEERRTVVACRHTCRAVRQRRGLT
jgi:hypothetical protein